MQNGNVWVLTKRNRMIWKGQIEGSESDPNLVKITSEVDDDTLKRKPIKKMFVDPRGLHCFFLAEHEIFYNHWSSNRVFQITTSSKLDSQTSTQPRTFRSIDLQYVSPKNFDIFEILVGTDDGNIYHSAFMLDPKGID